MEKKKKSKSRGTASDRNAERKTGAYPKAEKQPTKAESKTAVLSAPPRPQGTAYPQLSELDDDRARSLCEHFGRAVKERNALVCFLLDFLPPDTSAGLELAAFRRAELLREYCGVEPWLLVNYYQPSMVENGLEQLKLGRLKIAHLANLYDFVQGINRSNTQRKKAELILNVGWKASLVKDTQDYIVHDGDGKQLLYVHQNQAGELEYVNYIKDDRIVRRDTYDPLGFISRTEFVTAETGQTHTALFYRQDRTLCLMETYRAPDKPGDRPVIDTVNILDKNGFTIQRFTYRDELIAWWLLQLLGNKQTTYLCVADQLMDYQRYFVELKKQRQSYPNVRVAAVSHNCHVVDPLDVMNSTLGDNYRFLYDQNQRVDRVITLTEWQKVDVKARFKAEAHPITVIPHAVPYTEEELNTPRDSSCDLPPHSIVLIGRFAENKNQLKALDVIEEVRKSVPDATLHFYGAGGNEEEVQAEIKKRGLDTIVTLHGFHPDLKPVYRSAALTLSLSVHEGFGLNILEALSLGCPVVAFACRYGPSEIITDGEDGYLLESDDFAGATERCVRLLQDESLMQTFRTRAKDLARRFSPQRVAALWAQLLTELLELKE